MRVFRATYNDRQGLNRESRRFYVELRDHNGIVRRLPGFPSERMTAKLGENVQALIDCQANHERPTGDLVKWLEALPNRTAKVLMRWGLLAGQSFAARKPLTEHLADWKAAMLAKGMTDKHAKMMHHNAERIFKACKASFVSEIQPGKVQAAIAELRKDKIKPVAGGSEPGKVQKVIRGLSLQTCNHITAAAKAFTHWLCRDGRLQADPLAHLTKFNVRTDRRHDRRDLSDAEATALIQAAEKGPTILGITGLARAMLYRLAIGTGFRKSELASLTPESFNLDGEPPTITVKAGYSKHRREDVQPIRQDLADTLRAYLRGLPTGEPVFAMPDKAFKVLKADLTSARDKFIKAATTGAERTECEKSGFCKYKDDAGRFADFHALRHTYVSRLVKSNASVKVCQELARHSDPKLTLGVYSHVGLVDTAAALDGLPVWEPPQSEPQAAVALRTGTDDLPTAAGDKPQKTGDARLAFCLARNSTIQRNSAKSGEVKAEQRQDEKTPINIGKSFDSQGKLKMRPAGVEPATFGSVDRRSIQLSYERFWAPRERFSPLGQAFDYPTSLMKSKGGINAELNGFSREMASDIRIAPPDLQKKRNKQTGKGNDDQGIANRAKKRGFDPPWHSCNGNRSNRLNGFVDQALHIAPAWDPGQGKHLLGWINHVHLAIGQTLHEARIGGGGLNKAILKINFFIILIKRGLHNVALDLGIVNGTICRREDHQSNNGQGYQQNQPA
jgi:integrase